MSGFFEEIKKLRPDCIMQVRGTRAQYMDDITLLRFVSRVLSYEFLCVVMFRVTAASYRVKFLRPFALMLHQINKIIFSSDLHPGASIGGGFQIVHAFNNVVGARVTCGDNLTLFNGVTLGKKAVGMAGGQPYLGNDVVVGAGAKVLGEVKIADSVTIGANSVVISDVVSNNSVAVGSPARVLSNSNQESQ